MVSVMKLAMAMCFVFCVISLVILSSLVLMGASVITLWVTASVVIAVTGSFSTILIYVVGQDSLAKGRMNFLTIEDLQLKVFYQIVRIAPVVGGDGQLIQVATMVGFDATEPHASYQVKIVGVLWGYFANATNSKDEIFQFGLKTYDKVVVREYKLGDKTRRCLEKWTPEKVIYAQQ
jgi:hypothetical protein